MNGSVDSDSGFAQRADRNIGVRYDLFGYACAYGGLQSYARDLSGLWFVGSGICVQWCRVFVTRCTIVFARLAVIVAWQCVDCCLSCLIILGA